MVKKRKPQSTLKLDISFGPFVPPGFEKAKFDHAKYPWPLKDESVEEAYSAHLLIRIPGKQRPRFMDELYRVLEAGAKATFILPYWSSARAIQDFTHEWPPVVEQSFLYFNKTWREQNGIADYPVKCDFDFTYGYAMDAETQARSDDTRPFWIKHYNNAINDLQVVLTKK